MRPLFVFLCFSLCLSRAPAAEPREEMQSVVVKPGDTLWSVAQKYLKDPTKWDVILRYNKLPSSDVTVALPGMTLRIPIRSIRTELQAARIVSSVNRVLYRRKEGGNWLNAALDMEVFRNDTIKTMEDSRATVKFLDNELMQIDPDSMAIIMPTSKDYQIELKRGGVVASNKRIHIGSANVAPATSDTVYTARVREDDTVVVQVYKGRAAVEAAGTTVQVGAGKAVEARPGLAPSLPFDIPDLASFKSIVSGFEEKLAAFKSKIGKPAAPPKPAAPANSARAEGLAQDAASIKLMQAVMGYRVECSKTPDFEVLVVRQYFDADASMGPDDFDIPRDRYWCRMAAVDLLGTVDKFKEPKAYSLGRVR